MKMTTGAVAGNLPSTSVQKSLLWIIIGVVGVIAILWIATTLRSRGVKPAGISKGSTDIVQVGEGQYVERRLLGKSKSQSVIQPTTAKWIPAEVHEIPFHPVPGAIAGQTMGKIVVPAGQEIVIFEGLTSEWNLAVWYNTSSTNLVIEETYNGTTTASAKASVKKVPEPPPHLDQVWSLSVFVPTNQSPNDLTVGWRLSRK